MFNNLKIKKFDNFKYISMLSYILLFGSLRGILVYNNLFKLFIVLALIGGFLLVLKNKSITNELYKKKIAIFEIALIIISDWIYFEMPLAFFIKDIIVIAMLIVYISIYFNLFFKEKLIKRNP